MVLASKAFPHYAVEKSTAAVRDVHLTSVGLLHTGRLQCRQIEWMYRIFNAAASVVVSVRRSPMESVTTHPTTKETFTAASQGTNQMSSASAAPGMAP